MRNLIGPGTWIVLLLTLFACARDEQGTAANAADLGGPGTAEGRDAIYQHLMEFDGIGINANRDSTQQPENVLVKLHSYLTEGRGLKRITIDGHEALVINRLPDQVLRQVMAVAFPDTFRSGFEILQASFWQGVRDAMSEGLTIGFLEPDPSFNVSGVYFEKYNYKRGLILIDVFAGDGTLKHEHRHFLQARAANARANARWRWDWGPSTISETCLTATDRFLGELDATTTELPNWVGVFQTLDITPAWHKNAKAGDKDPIRFPQKDVLGTNLDYPGRTAAALKGLDCPQELIEAATKIGSSTDTFSTNAFETYTLPLSTLRMEHFRDSLYVNTSCAASPAPVACASKQARLAAIPGAAQTIKDALDSALRAEVIDRPNRIRAAFAALPEDLQEDLCEYASSYELLVDCKPFDAKKKGTSQ